MLSRTSLALVMAGSAVVAGGCPQRDPIGQEGGELTACAWDDARATDRAVLVTVAGRDLKVVRNDGTIETVLRFGREGAQVSAQVQSEDGFAFVQAWSSIMVEDRNETTVETALVDGEGRLRWRRTEAPYVEAAFLGEDGMVAVGDRIDGGLLVRPDGSSASYGLFIPMAGPRADGIVAARRISWGPGAAGWATPGGSDLVSLALEDGGDQPIAFGRDIVYLSVDEAGNRIVVRESPDAVRVIELPLLPEAAYLCALGVPNRAGWIVVHDWTAPLAAVDLESGAARKLDVTIPAGLRRFNYGAFFYDTPGIDEEGAILMALRDDLEGGLYRSLDGVTWRRVGESVSDVMNVEADVRAGTVAILATNARYSDEQWPDGITADIEGDSMQVVRGSDGIVETLPAPYDAWVASTVRHSLISDDGDCVAYADMVDGAARIQVLRVSTGERTDVAGPIVYGASFATTWITSASR